LIRILIVIKEKIRITYRKEAIDKTEKEQQLCNLKMIHRSWCTSVEFLEIWKCGIGAPRWWKLWLLPLGLAYCNPGV